MKAKRISQLIALAGVVALVLVSCGPLPVSITERVTDFIDALNMTTRTGNIEGNFHPTLTQDYVSGAINTFSWEQPFPLVSGGTAYSQINIDTTNSPTVVVTIDGPSAFGGPKDLKLLMALYGTDDWRIQTLSINASAGSTSFSPLIQ